MAVDGVHADIELPGDLLGIETGADEFDYARLLRRQRQSALG